MATIKAGAIENGMYLFYKHAPYVVLERVFVSPGKGSAFTKMKLRNLRNGQSLQETLKTQDNVEQIDITNKKCQFLYNDGESIVMMDNDSFEQESIHVNGLEHKLPYLREGETYIVSKWENEILDIELPAKMVFTVTHVVEAIKGDTVGGVKTDITLDTGLVVKGPNFIKVGEKIKVNTETGEYTERAND